MEKQVFVAAVLLCFLIMFAEVEVTAQEKGAAKTPSPMVPPVVRPPTVNSPPISFSLGSPEDIGDFSRTLKVVRGDSVQFLNQFAGGESKDAKKAGAAAWLLAEIRSDDEESIRALCANIGKNIPTDDENWGTPHSLSGRGAAAALVKIGGSRAKDTMIGRMCSGSP